MLKFMAQSCGAIHGVPTQPGADHHKRGEDFVRRRRKVSTPRRRPGNGAAFIVLCSLVVATGLVFSIA